MLNRRSLRVKAMQSLFAYNQCREANFNLGLEEIEETFKPDLNSMEPQDKDFLKAQKKQSKSLLANKVHGINLPENFEPTKEAEKAAKEAYKLFLDNSKKDRERLKKSMLLDAESLNDYFLWCIGLLIAWSDMSKVEADKKAKLSPERLQTGDYNLSKNRVIDYFRQASKFQLAMVKRDIDWNADEDNVKQWYKDVLKKDEEYARYRRTANPDFEFDKNIAEYIVKQILFKENVILSFFEEKDIRWIENKGIIRSLVSRTIRDLEEDDEAKSFSLPDFSNNWEEDREFFENIFDWSIDHDQEYSDIIASKTKNWEVDRLAIMDQIILKMAISEMLNFGSIPVKVTINEYIELSKNYSTPKSKQFVNGILDVVSNEFKEDGRLKKTGRGLIDNK
jgi:N utilization substance protein B